MMHYLVRPSPVLFFLWGLSACQMAAGAEPRSPASTPGSAVASPAALQHSELGLLLTWQRDPTTTMTIDWHTTEAASEPLQYRPRGVDATLGGWRSAEATRRPFPFTDRTVHRVELTGLTPGRAYEFRIGGSGPVRWFRTMPMDAKEPIRFIAGGDIRHQRDWMENTARGAMRYDPEFVLVGGDLAYADGREDRADRWIEFFEVTRDAFVTHEGRVVPMIASIGNHEVRGGYSYNSERFDNSDAWREEHAPYFYTFFAFPGHPGYGVLDVGDYLSMLVLDTDHSTPIAGAQTEWLAERLAQRRNVPHVFPIYHVPGYPSVRPFEGDPVIERVREHWVPLFERHGVRIAFENHDHAYKRTVPLREGRAASDGVVYMGDGAWGVETREIGSRNPTGERMWYLERAESVRHFIVVTLQGTHQHLLTVDEDGRVIDEYPATFRADPLVVVGERMEAAAAAVP
jgi:acid phosphatase type 7